MQKVSIGLQNVFISASVFKTFKFYQQNSVKKHEAGGILIGQIVDNNLEINKATIPNKFDKSSRRSFVRNKDAAQIAVDYEFHNSKRRAIYLGEWHTHPENKPVPSLIDINMIEEQYRINILNSDRILLIIVGLKQLFVGIYNGKTLDTINIPFQ